MCKLYCTVKVLIYIYVTLMFEFKGIDLEELSSKFMGTDCLEVGRKARFIRNSAIAWQEAFSFMEKVNYFELHLALFPHRHRFDRYSWGFAISRHRTRSSCISHQENTGTITRSFQLRGEGMQ